MDSQKLTTFAPEACEHITAHEVEQYFGDNSDLAVVEKVNNRVDACDMCAEIFSGYIATKVAADSVRGL